MRSAQAQLPPAAAPHVSAALVGSMQAQPVVPAPPEARVSETSVNIAIEEMKDFSESVAPLRELYSEFCTADGKCLFECQGLTKDTGIDLMDCPLNINLKLRVRRRMPQGAHVLWHVVLPMPLISKHLLSPPYEWQTWIGLLPNTMNLDAHPADVMFTQSVHLISRPDFPKLRLRFKYNNFELQAQQQAQKEREDHDLKQRDDMSRNVGKKAFEDLQSFQSLFKAPASSSGSVGQPAASAAGYDAERQPVQGASVNVEAPSQNHQDGAVVAVALQFASAVRDLLATAQGRHETAAPLPVPTVGEVLSSQAPSQMMDATCKPLLQRLQVALMSAQNGGPNGRNAGSNNAELERELVNALQMAQMGIIDDSEGSKIPRTATNLSSTSAEQISNIQNRFPGLMDSYRQVSLLAKERAALQQEQSKWSDARRRLQEELMSTRKSLEVAQQAESSKNLEKMMGQQRQMLQLTFDKEVSALKHQLAETERAARERESEVAQLRAELGESRR